MSKRLLISEGLTSTLLRTAFLSLPQLTAKGVGPCLALHASATNSFISNPGLYKVIFFVLLFPHPPMAGSFYQSCLSKNGSPSEAFLGFFFFFSQKQQLGHALRSSPPPCARISSSLVFSQFS